MHNMIVIETEIDEDGKLSLQLPPDSPRGPVEVIIREVKPAYVPPHLTSEEDAALEAELKDLLSDEGLKGLGLTAEEIANSPAFGIWADRTDITDSVEFIESMRRKRHERRANRD
jgi:hypothetical protein